MFWVRGLWARAVLLKWTKHHSEQKHASYWEAFIFLISCCPCMDNNSIQMWYSLLFVATWKAFQNKDTFTRQSIFKKSEPIWLFSVDSSLPGVCGKRGRPAVHGSLTLSQTCWVRVGRPRMPIPCSCSKPETNFNQPEALILTHATLKAVSSVPQLLHIPHFLQGLSCETV